MIDFLDAVAGYLEEEGVGTTATDIFVNKQPADVNNCVTLYGRPGQVTASQRYISLLQQPRLQVIVRNTDYNDAYDKFQAIRTALSALMNVNLPVGVNTETDPYLRVMSCYAEQEGGPIGEDEKGRTEFSMTFIAQYHHYDPA